MKKYDVVYILRNDIDSEEIRYSIRSVVKNFPYNNIWFCGGKPDKITPDKEMLFLQEGVGKFGKVYNTYLKIIENDEITENFWLFNDDFFVMSPIAEYTPWHNGEIIDMVNRFEKAKGKQSKYTSRLRKTRDELIKHNLTTYNYALHVPMLMNKEKLKPVLEKFPECSPRIVYGNLNNIGGEYHQDVKIIKTYVQPDEKGLHKYYLSTKDKSFRDGIVGTYIRNKFKNSCKYEK